MRQGGSRWRGFAITVAAPTIDVIVDRQGTGVVLPDTQLGVLTGGDRFCRVEGPTVETSVHLDATVSMLAKINGTELNPIGRCPIFQHTAPPTFHCMVGLQATPNGLCNLNIGKVIALDRITHVVGVHVVQANRVTPTLNAARTCDTTSGCVSCGCNLNHGVYLGILANALEQSGRDAEAVDILQTAVARDPDYFAGHLRLASLYGLAGRLDEARTQAAEVLRINPRFDLSRAPSFYITANPDFLARFVDGLRMAGLPE